MFSPVSLDLNTGPVNTALKKLGPLAGQEGAQALLPELRSLLFGARTRIRNRTGRLSASGQVRVPRVYHDAVVGKVTFGDKGISYAVAVHQIPGKPSYKYLENAAKTLATGMEGRLAARLGSSLAARLGSLGF